MDSTLRELTVSIDFDRIDLSGINRMDRAIDSLERNIRGLDNDIDRMGDETRQAGARGTRAIRDMGEEADKTGNKLAEMLQEMVPDSKLAGAAAKFFSNPWVLASAAVVGAIGGVGIALLKIQAESDKIFDRMQANAGMSTEQRAKATKSAIEVYSKGFGEDLEDAASSVGMLNSAFKGTNQAEIEKLAKGMLTLKDGFTSAPEIKETAKVINSMTKNFDGLSKTDALDLITFGFQQNADYADDFLDTLNEYSVYFGKIGVSAQDFMGILLKGAEAGAFNLDKVGDTIKEIGIRAMDGSETTKDAFTKLGFSAKDMGQKFANGGEQGQKALMATIAALSFVDDKVQQNAIGVELFGTQWEDMRDKVIFAMDGAGDAVKGFQGSTERATAVLQDNADTKWSIIWRTLKGEVISAMDESGISVNGFLDGVISKMPMVGESIRAVIRDFVDLSKVFTNVINGDFGEAANIINKSAEGNTKHWTDNFPSLQGIADKTTGMISGLNNMVGLPTASMPSTSGGVHAPINVQLTPPIGMTQKEATDTGSAIGKAINQEIFSVFNQLNTKFQK